MNLTFRGIGFTPDDEDREFLDKKLKTTLCLEEGEGGIAGCL